MPVVAGVLAAGVAWLVNTYLINRLLAVTVIAYIAPVLEEVLKTGFALVFNTSILVSHGVFGMVEGTYELKKLERTGIMAASLSVISHIFFGGLTQLLISIGFSVVPSIGISSFFHCLWNLLMVSKR